MPRKITLSADDERRFREQWQAGVPVCRIADAFGLTTDSANLIRARLGLSARTPRTRAKRRERQPDPTPDEIEAACAELRAKHLAKRLAEPPRRQYRGDDEYGCRVYPAHYDPDE